MQPESIQLEKSAGSNDASPQHHETWNGRIVVLWSGLGEFAWAKRIENACRKLGWECVTSIDPAELSEYDKLVQDRPSTFEEIQTLISKHQPDCVISLKWERIYAKDIPHYLSVTGVFNHLIRPDYLSGIKVVDPDNADLVFAPAKDLLSFNGILHSMEIEPLKDYFVQHGKKLNSMEWYPSSTASEYSPVIPQTIFHCGFQWDEKRNGLEYRKMFSSLDQEGYLDIYGPAHKWDCTPNSVRGMTFDEEEFRLAMRKSGIVLILHTKKNIEQGAPAARIFEAAAACCVIISDKHPFIVKEFGDCILYIDHTQPGYVLFQQIKAHRKWILENPEEAELMAKRAHAIFSEKFTLEKQLETFKNFHLHLLRDKEI